MIKLRHFLLLFVLWLTAQGVFAQSWTEMMADPTVNFYEVQDAFDAYWKDKDHTQKGKGWKAFKRWEWFVEQRVAPEGDRTVMQNAIAKFYDESNHTEQMDNRSNGNSWSFIGPTNVPDNRGGAGRCNFVRLDPSDPNNIWVGSPGGGLWKSENGGNSWTNWNTDNLPVIGCSDIAIDPYDNNILYLATGDAYSNDTYSIGVMKSTDGGQTWNLQGWDWTVNLTNVIRRLVIHPTKSNILIAATSAGLFRTEDAGQTWKEVRSGNFYDLEFKPDNPSFVFASGRQVFISNDEGASWTLTNAGIPPTNQIRRIEMAVTPAAPDYLYLMVSNMEDNGFLGLYRSTDAGQSFNLQSNSPNVMGWSSDGQDAGGQGWFTLSVAASPVDPDLVIVGGVNVWRSQDGGVTWGIIGHWWGDNAPYVHADIHDLLFLPGSSSTYFAACDGGLFKTSNNAASWEDLSDGLEIAQIYRLGTSATVEKLIITGWQDNGSNLWDENGWRRVLGGDGMECIIDHKNANIMYGEYYYGYIEKTLNGGDDWFTIVHSDEDEGVNSRGLWVTPYVLNPKDNLDLLVGKQGLYRSLDGGLSWNEMGFISGAGQIRAIAYAPTNPDFIYVARTNTIHVSKDGGLTFQNITSTLPQQTITYIAVSEHDPNRVYVTYSGYVGGNKVYLSNNAGGSWVNYSQGLPNLPVNCIVYNQGTADAVYVGTDVGVYYRNGSMTSWTAFSNGLPNVVVNELEIHYDAWKLRAATYGRGVWEVGLLDPKSGPPQAAFQLPASGNCEGKTITFLDASVSYPTEWVWTFEGGTPATSSEKSPQVTWFSPGTYNVTLTVSNSAGSSTIVKSITINPSPTVSVQASHLAICAGQSITLSATGANNYLWNSGLGSGANKTTSPFVTTTYTVTGNANGCTNTASVTVQVTPIPALTIQTDKETYCEGDAITLTATGAQEYSWNNGEGNGNVFVILATVGTTVDLFGANGVCTSTTTFVPQVFAGPDLTLIADKFAICEGESVTLEALGGDTVSWAHTLDHASIQIVTPVETTTYAVSASDETGCWSFSDVIITVHPNPTILLSESSGSFCEGSTITITASGADLYIWSNGDLTSSTVLEILSSGALTVNGSTEFGCSGEATFTWDALPLPSLVVTPDSIVTCQDGEALKISAEGAIEYKWSVIGLTGPMVFIAPSSPTPIIVEGIGENGCSGFVIIPVTILPSPEIQIEASATEICKGSTVLLTASGADYWVWLDNLGNQNQVEVTPVNTTYFSVSGFSEFGCMSTEFIQIQVKSPALNLTTWPDPTCNSGYFSVASAGDSPGAWQFILPDGIPSDFSFAPDVIGIFNTQTPVVLSAIADYGAIQCPVYYDIPTVFKDPVELIYDPCQHTLTHASICQEGTTSWYRIRKSNREPEFITETTDGSLGNIALEDLDQWAYFSYCQDHCQSPMGFFSGTSSEIDPCVKNFNFVLAPNPARTSIFLLLELPAEADFQVWIWDALGRHIDYHAFNYPIGKHQHPLNIGHLTAGMYVLKLHRKDGVSWYRTFLVH